MGPIMGLGEGKAAMVVPCTGDGRAGFAKERLFRDVMLLRRLLVRSLVCNIKWRRIGGVTISVLSWKFNLNELSESRISNSHNISFLVTSANLDAIEEKKKTSESTHEDVGFILFSKDSSLSF